MMLLYCRDGVTELFTYTHIPPPTSVRRPDGSSPKISERAGILKFRRMSSNPWQLYKLTKDLAAMWYQVADVMDAILMIVKEEVRL